MEKKGIVTARTCPRCGHHEIGFISIDGVFHTLEPGTFIQVLESSGEKEFGEGPPVGHDVLHADRQRAGIDPADADALIEIPGRPHMEEEEDHQYDIWVPEPLKGDHRFRLKFGVMVEPDTHSAEMTPDAYRAAYIQKLQHLIEKEVYVPVAVILDRFFTAPHLASGTPKDIAETMWRELDEIKVPVNLVSAWLNARTDENLAGMIRPVPKEELESAPVDDASAVREFETLSLEDFLEML